ncbi:MAG: metallophosphoesterase [[Clostridium] innocuum]
MRMLLFLLLCLLILLLVQLFFWYTVKKLFKKKQVRYALLAVSLLGSGMLIYRFTPFFVMNKDAMAMRGTLIMILTSIYLPQMAGFCLLALLQKLYCKKHHRIFCTKLYAFASVIMLLFSVYGIGCASRVKVRQEIVEMKGVQQEQRLLYISDLHAGTTLSPPYGTIKRFAKDCDIVLLGGDLYDEATSHRDMEALCRMLSDLHKNIYYAGGNHELLQKQHTEYEAMLRSAGVHVLQDESAMVNGIRIIGRKDRGEDRRSWSSLMKGVREDAPVILLEHRPKAVTEAVNAELLQLSGHTHNGQIFPNTVLTRIPYPKAYGSYDVGYRMLVSSGAGTWGFPMRVASHNEILVITIRPRNT